MPASDPVDGVPGICDASAVARGVGRLFLAHGLSCVPELTLANGRRVDVAGLDGAGGLTFVEIKVSVADFRADAKWPEYLPFCDAFYFAVPDRFPRDMIPDEAGLIVADAYGGAILREAPHNPVSAARRKAVLLRFAHCAAGRLQRLCDPQGGVI